MNVVTQVIKSRGPEYYICAMFLLFLPFSQALTISIGFPLKLSEIFTFAFIIYSLLKYYSKGEIKFTKQKPFGLIMVFIFLVAFSVIINVDHRYSYYLNNIGVRISTGFDSFLKFFYLLLAYVAMRITIYSISKYGREIVIKWYLRGAIIAACYGIYLFVSSFLKIPYFLLPGISEPQTLNLSIGGAIIRSGTFKEGNYMGLYLFISGVVANYYNQRKTSAFLLGSIITTFSSASFICLLIYIVSSVNIKTQAARIRVFAGGIAITVMMGFLLKSEDFRSVLINKIFENENTARNANDVYSKLDRLNTTNVGLEMFLDNPFWGVGMNNYSLHFDHYNKLPQFGAGAGEFKRIANNVYIEILSESGIFAFMGFLLFLITISAYSFQLKNRQIFLGTLLSFIYIVAFPTYTMLYLWFFWGFIISENSFLLNSKTA